MDLLTDMHLLTIKQVLELSGCFMGGKTQGLAISTDMKIKSIDPNKPKNAGLVNRQKIKL